ncbi:hypothetical protein O9G_000772 [Rozella allomycis CSF55]|uniref:Uncharacterized protein n=1 Tax=Rozella allomycis (strain CSF55) TaxID=988480 RepID=A0A075AVG8_ROZAC|nr:hypothetical protein O9G_000772 [Rozella allomycis CSF55]|eukprot:EPZ32697.1 hypothetical protein O9G_000772 [Rozella allomycis CSF55]
MIADDDSQLFQADADVAAKARRLAKKNLDFGDAFECSSQVNDVAVLGDYAYTAESAAVVRKNSQSEKIYKGHTAPVTCLKLVNLDNQLYIVTGSWDKKIRLINEKTGNHERVYNDHSDFVKCMDIAYNKKLLASGSSDKTIVVRSLIDNSIVTTIKAHSRAVEALVIDPNEEFIFSASSDRTIKQWRLDTGEMVETFEGHVTSVYCLWFDNDYLYSGSADNTIRQWDINAKKQTALFEHNDWVKSVIVIGQYLIGGSRDENMYIWDINTEKQVGMIQGHHDQVQRIAQYNSMLISVSLDGTLRRWNLMDEINGGKKKMKKDKAPDVAMTAEEEKELEDLLNDFDE